MLLAYGVIGNSPLCYSVRSWFESMWASFVFVASTLKKRKLLLLVLTACPAAGWTDEPRLTVEMDQVLRSGQEYPFIIHTTGDSLVYSFWSRMPYDGWYQQTTDYVVSLGERRGVTSTFRTCRAVRAQVFGGAPCDPVWIKGQWELRAVVWRWQNGKRWSATKTWPFVVK